MNINLKKLAKQVDEVFAKETKETLTKWLNERRATCSFYMSGSDTSGKCSNCKQPQCLH